MTIDDALATIENPTGIGDKTWLLTVYVPAAKAIAAEVRRLREARKNIEAAHILLRVRHAELQAQYDTATMALKTVVTGKGLT